MPRIKPVRSRTQIEIVEYPGSTDQLRAALLGPNNKSMKVMWQSAKEFKVEPKDKESESRGAKLTVKIIGDATDGKTKLELTTYKSIKSQLIGIGAGCGLVSYGLRRSGTENWLAYAIPCAIIALGGLIYYFSKPLDFHITNKFKKYLSSVT